MKLHGNVTWKMGLLFEQGNYEKSEKKTEKRLRDLIMTSIWLIRYLCVISQHMIRTLVLGADSFICHLGSILTERMPIIICLLHQIHLHYF